VHYRPRRRLPQFAIAVAAAAVAGIVVAVALAAEPAILDVDDTTLATWKLRDRPELGVQRDDERPVRDPAALPRRAGNRPHGHEGCGGGLQDLLPHRCRQALEAATLGNLTSDGVGVDAGYPPPTTLSNGEDGLFTNPRSARIRRV
jgi:hypothetical protein